MVKAFAYNARGPGFDSRRGQNYSKLVFALLLIEQISCVKRIISYFSNKQKKNISKNVTFKKEENITRKMFLELPALITNYYNKSQK